MKAPITHLVHLGLLAGVAAMAVACGSKSSSSPAPATAAPTVAPATTSNLAGDQSQAPAQSPTPAPAPAPAPSPAPSSSSSSSTTTNTTVVVAPATPAPAQVFQVSPFYSVTVQQNMHMQEYFSRQNPQAAQDFFKVMPTSDPTYIGNYACNGVFDLATIFSDWASNSYVYCSITPPSGGFNDSWLTNNRTSSEHIRYATNPSTGIETYIDVNVYNGPSGSHAYNSSASLFSELCSGFQVEVSPYIPVMTSFYSDAVPSQIFLCQRTLVSSPLSQAGAVGSNYWVAVMYISSSGAAFPSINSWNGTPCIINDKNLLEVTMVSSLTAETNYQFIQRTQGLLNNTLHQIVPIQTN